MPRHRNYERHRNLSPISSSLDESSSSRTRRRAPRRKPHGGRSRDRARPNKTNLKKVETEYYVVEQSVSDLYEELPVAYSRPAPPKSKKSADYEVGYAAGHQAAYKEALKVFEGMCKILGAQSRRLSGT